ncbi:MAG: penicillin-binding protein 2 [Alphaproteobacteria bacterium]|nr:penicillin-binding protein 2 [Alphaproteobacteria bacterium]MBU1512982.1 penicillin-binding protein 2 [Alphaproteobacteria bacterium]MBU2094844.1 penicillin-binding protein 2 [Alphaproteobacteria bacterium]MBU2152750.1 penicillin-binding protein 2 [Alphaproteobacteria bacterium]MBU2306341.1 penicillin-binding protein 2 [Alphaproteobacteria bacterium]
MTQPSIFFEEVNERQGTFHRRTVVLGAFAGLGVTSLVARLAYLQLFETQRYEKMAVSNQFNFKLLPAPRGVIVDRNGAVLAANRPNFRLMVARDGGMDPETTLHTLAEFVPLDAVRQRRLLKDINAAPKRAPIQVMEDMSWEQFTAISVREPELPGVSADMGEVRVYPYGGAFAHVIGYVAKVNREDIAPTGPNADPIMLHPGFRIGRQGVEKAFDIDLRGKPGAEKVEVDANGRQVREDPNGDIAATPGKEIQLTLDVDVQLRAEEVFAAESGAAVVMDCRNGDILCMFSGPSFDANRFVRGLTGAEYRALSTYDHKPLFNKALTATYPPGSTFKTMVALSALENGYDPNTVHVCSGRWFFGRTWKCDQVHGAQNMHNAIATSCDIYFYQTALAIGPDKIADTARKFGLGEIFDIGIPGQKKGLVPDTAYKKRRFPKDPKWHPGETPSMGIGQGYTNLNPLQLCVMTSRIANGEKALHPRLIRSIGGVEQKSGAAWGELPVDKNHLLFVREAMAAVTTGIGTAARVSDLGLGPIKMAGKTGTAQAYSYGAGRGVHGTAGAWKLRDHAWFVAFAPYDDPRYAISVLVEHGGFGASAAAPKAREIMRTVLLKDAEVMQRVQTVTPMPPAPEESPPAVTPDPGAKV